MTALFGVIFPLIPVHSKFCLPLVVAPGAVRPCFPLVLSDYFQSFLWGLVLNVIPGPPFTTTLRGKDNNQQRSTNQVIESNSARNKSYIHPFPLSSPPRFNKTGYLTLFLLLPRFFPAIFLEGKAKDTLAGFGVHCHHERTKWAVPTLLPPELQKVFWRSWSVSPSWELQVSSLSCPPCCFLKRVAH